MINASNAVSDHKSPSILAECSVRDGEWLEITPHNDLLQAGGNARHKAVMQWLEEVSVPVKLSGRLHSKGEVKIDGAHIRLRLFPPMDYGFDPRPHDRVKVLYEDDYVLVMHKPAGMNVHPSEASDPTITLAHAVADHYQKTNQKCAVRHVHRLDEDTTGPVLYAKNEFALSKLDEQMRCKTIDRKYIAIVQGKVSDGLTVIDQPIGKDRHHKQRRRVSPTGQEAITHVEKIYGSARASLVRLTLETGRTHQIRVHMSDAGHTLIGDVLYGGSQEFYRQALHGEQLTFEHPFTEQTMTVNDPLPEDMTELVDQLGIPRP
ncbi:RluA family pseudouridine synthase [Paenibacillus sp. PK4536]|uniref:RluA family pseudouridine synthase n=1 Tax=Paenibacillus sp. PK4536 TaxID=3024576 RepID=UPI00235822F2|nr:RluA family pseudouridine synthase [Paenibacillus sp. PK4536]WIM39365.1 RluA family pseudouridine synthase [Paenibacillus sp. PK4536]